MKTISNAHKVLIELQEEAFKLHHEGVMNAVEWGQIQSCINQVKIYTYRYSLDKDSNIGTV